MEIWGEGGGGGKREGKRLNVVAHLYQAKHTYISVRAMS